ncbi:uncharacterized protein BDW47DRAFT_115991 [Aspergillus candidus]|uniref:Restriction endonuclease type IV Mrr domain-containing protein n=1 Tax=Aspergillus candidus TaxID=41067 RepID=A0A2I2FHR4_ASPCN|nr:hypothetical protein BDW47DRAFT_115991 [Aspergillus candidus]PLB40162.1 hypothetical protein BDW47DRAFT_115991 [Aspergillus candidus]
MRIHRHLRPLLSPFSLSSPIHHISPTSRPKTIHTFTQRLFKLPTPPTPTPNAHTNLSSFLTYTTRTALAPHSTTYIGTHYEYTVQQTLRASNFTLHRTGGRADAGIDLLGTWHVPGREHPVRTIVQCKALKTKLGPNLVRELEGTFASAPAGWRTGDEVGVLVSPREATRGVREALARSAFPLVWMLVGRDGVLRQALWNGRKKEGGAAVGLTWDGEELAGMDAVEGEMASAEERWMGMWMDGGGEMGDAEKWELLEVVERLFPEEKPLLLGTGKRCSALSEEERARVVQTLRERRALEGEERVAASG